MRGHTLCSGVSNEGLLQPKGLKQTGIKEGVNTNKLYICLTVHARAHARVCVCVNKTYLDCFMTLLLLARTSTTHIHGEQFESFPACNKSAACVTTECTTVCSCMSDSGVPKKKLKKLN
jgi:hypothetical protein